MGIKELGAATLKALNTKDCSDDLDRNNDVKIQRAGTFQLNRGEAIHSWYSYIEGYSSCFVEKILDELKDEKIDTVYDPFCGTGTTPLVATQRGLMTYYSESNPFMVTVIEAKINSVKRLIDSGIGTTVLQSFIKKLDSLSFQRSLISEEFGGFKKFFDNEALDKIIYIKHIIASVDEKDSRALLMLALSSIIVPTSKMIRRGDLRFAKGNEKKPGDSDVFGLFRNKVNDIIVDINSHGSKIRNFSKMISSDARDIDIIDQIDCVITSPPYLNGTNYIRNTKLELKLNDFIKTEDDLPEFHSKGIVAGINNISKRNGEIPILPVVQSYIDALTPVAYDKRIVKMVAGYFYDMKSVIEKLARAMKDKAIFIMDIGDSQFAGIHIPTHEILSNICESHGFIKYDEEILRERRSKNGMVLSQRLLKFRLSKPTTPDERLKTQAENFINTMPYKTPPYDSRNWGNSWHSLCSYHGKLKPAIASLLVSNFTERGDIVLDPLSGVGTIPFEACLQGRKGIGNDLSEMAYIVTKAKLEKPNECDVIEVIKQLDNYLKLNINGLSVVEDQARYATFGFNGKLHEYFHPDTFKEILCARRFFIDKIPTITAAECLAYSAFLHVLHGNRPYALSRNSHPLTPYAPKGEFIYKSVIEHIKKKSTLTYKKGDFSTYLKGEAIHGDYAVISNLNGKVDAIICSPPFADSIRFYMNNWMRLWLCGWELSDYKEADKKFLDLKQVKDFSVYQSFFQMCHRVLKPTGRVILHLGKTKKVDMADELMIYAEPYFTEVYRGSENVSNVEKHGIKDKGVTLEHQYLFLLKK
ncbi:MAG: DNA methyltransferase [Sphaerochaeta sp.]|nr:DNA methyltransferase [Sphaerochaeta sp.]